jgi:hypothetical protein
MTLLEPRLAELAGPNCLTDPGRPTDTAGDQGPKCSPITLFPTPVPTPEAFHTMAPSPRSRRVVLENSACSLGTDL